MKSNVIRGACAAVLSLSLGACAEGLGPDKVSGQSRGICVEGAFDPSAVLYIGAREMVLADALAEANDSPLADLRAEMARMAVLLDRGVEYDAEAVDAFIDADQFLQRAFEAEGDASDPMTLEDMRVANQLADTIERANWEANDLPCLSDGDVAIDTETEPSSAPVPVAGSGEDARDYALTPLGDEGPALDPGDDEVAPPADALDWQGRENAQHGQSRGPQN